MQGYPYDDFLPGFLLDRYRVEGILTECAGRVTMQAFDTHTKRSVLVKAFVRTSSQATLEAFRVHRELFAREVDVAARTGFHSHLVAVLDYAIGDDNALYLVLEYVPGGDLVTAFARQPPTFRNVLRVAADVADGLHAAHTAGVVHCHVEPRRIFMSANGRAKIGGFGRAKIDGDTEDARGPASYLGSAGYRSLEQEASMRSTTDQYSLGLILFEMLTGARHQTLTTEEVAARMDAQQDAVAQLLSRLLARDPVDRFESMGDVAGAFAALFNHVYVEGEVTRRPGPAGASGIRSNRVAGLSSADTQIEETALRPRLYVGRDDIVLPPKSHPIPVSVEQAVTAVRILHHRRLVGRGGNGAFDDRVPLEVGGVGADDKRDGAEGGEAGRASRPGQARSGNGGGRCAEILTDSACLGHAAGAFAGDLGGVVGAVNDRSDFAVASEATNDTVARLDMTCPVRNGENAATERMAQAWVLLARKNGA